MGLVAPQLRADTVIQSRVYESNEVVSEWAAYDLETQGTVTIEDGADVRFSTGQRITLKAGFSVEAGGLFQASVSSFPSYDPGGYYDATSPTLAVLSGDEQSGAVDSFNALPFDIAVFNSGGSVPLVNAPVMLMVEQGGGGLSTDNSVSAQTSGVLRLLTDSEGTVQAYYKHGSVANVTSYIRVIAGAQVAMVTAHSVEGQPVPVDSDVDGLPDEWEALYLGGLTAGSSGNADGDSLTNAQEYEAGRLPQVADDYPVAALYVIDTIGSDSLYSGRSAWPGKPSVGHGPKASLSVAFAAADSTDRIFVVASSTPYLVDEGRLSLSGKNIILRPVGEVKIY